MKKKLLIISICLFILFLIKFSVESIVKQAVIREVGKKSPLLGLEIGSLSFSVFQPGITLKDILVKQAEIESGYVGLVHANFGSWTELINVIRSNAIILSNVNIAIQNLNLNPVVLEEKGALAIKYMGLARIEGTIKLNASVNLDEGVFVLNKLSLYFKDLFETNLSLQVTGISKALLAIKPEETPDPEVLALVEMSSLRLAYFDLSGIARAMNLESYPEFAPAKETPEMAKNKKVNVSKETDLKIVKFFTEYLQKPNTIDVIQDSGTKLKIGLFKETYLAKAIDVADLLNILSIHVYVESQKFL